MSVTHCCTMCHSAPIYQVDIGAGKREETSRFMRTSPLTTNFRTRKRARRICGTTPRTKRTENRNNVQALCKTFQQPFTHSNRLKPIEMCKSLIEKFHTALRSKCTQICNGSRGSVFSCNVPRPRKGERDWKEDCQ